MIPRVIDSHAHLFLHQFDGDRDAVIERAREASVEAIVNIGTDPATSRAAVELARRPGLFAAAGLHPSEPAEDRDRAIEEIRAIAEAGAGRVVAIGEIGLDFHWKDVAPEEQIPRLSTQLDLALDLELPVVVHCREALPELFRLLESRRENPPGVFHCFAGDDADARRAQALGFHVSFAGNITYRKAEDLRAAARAVEPDRLLLETDSPYLPPEGRRGRRNEPAFAVLTRDFLADLFGVPPEELARTTAENTRRLFALPPEKLIVDS